MEVDGSDFGGERGERFREGAAAGEVGGGETGEDLDQNWWWEVVHGEERERVKRLEAMTIIRNTI